MWLFLPPLSPTHDCSSAPSPSDVFSLMGNNGTAPFYAAQLGIPAAGQIYLASACGIDITRSYTVYMIARDLVTPYPNNQSSADVVAVTPAGSAANATQLSYSTCTAPFLTRTLRPALQPASASPLLALGPGGLLPALGAGTASRGFQAAGLGLPGTTVSIDGLLSPAQGVPLPGTASALSVTGARAAAASIALFPQRESTVYSDDPAVFAKFQLRDSVGASAVDSTGLQVSLSLQMSGATYSLGTCSGAPDATTGVGSCAASITNSSLFPAGSSANATLVATASYSGTAAASASATLTLVGPVSQLRCAPSPAPPLFSIPRARRALQPIYSVPTTAGMTIQCPTGVLYPQQTLDAQITANSGGISLRRWLIPVYYNTSYLSYVGGEETGLHLGCMRAGGRLILGPCTRSRVLCLQPLGGLLGQLEHPGPPRLHNNGPSVHRHFGRNDGLRSSDHHPPIPSPLERVGRLLCSRALRRCL